MKLKKWGALLLALCMIVMVFPTTAMADANNTSGPLDEKKVIENDLVVQLPSFNELVDEPADGVSWLAVTAEPTWEDGTILGYGNSTSSTLTIYSDSVSSKAEYVNFSTDGKNFANGVEEYRLNSETGEASYTGNLSVDGPEPGQMNFTVVLSKDFKLLKDKSLKSHLYQF